MKWFTNIAWNIYIMHSSIHPLWILLILLYIYLLIFFHFNILFILFFNILTIRSFISFSMRIFQTVKVHPRQQYLYLFTHYFVNISGSERSSSVFSRLCASRRIEGLCFREYGGKYSKQCLNKMGKLNKKNKYVKKE